MNRAPRFTLAHPPDPYGIAIVAGAELHHMRDVMRLREGAAVELIDSTGREYEGAIVAYERDRAVIRVGRSRASQPGTRIILAAATIKGPRMDFLAEKAAELGAAELWPIRCARCVAGSPGAARLARWRRLALAAAKQSRAARPMAVREPMEFADLLRGTPPGALAIVCTIGAEPLGGVIREQPRNEILIACGPEGDFNDDERAAALRAGFVAAGLGPNRLRSETAAIAAVSVAAEAMAAKSRRD
ncbi:MAG: RsmE family RNA methyltransferase [Candidatus Binataceae bacterium]